MPFLKSIHLRFVITAIAILWRYIDWYFHNQRFVQPVVSDICFQGHNRKPLDYATRIWANSRKLLGRMAGTQPQSFPHFHPHINGKDSLPDR